VHEFCNDYSPFARKLVVQGMKGRQVGQGIMLDFDEIPAFVKMLLQCLKDCSKNLVAMKNAFEPCNSREANARKQGHQIVVLSILVAINLFLKRKMYLTLTDFWNVYVWLCVYVCVFV